MKKGTFHILQKLWAGQTLARIQMNIALSEERIAGKVLDVGGGRNPDYFEYVAHAPGTILETIDGSMSGIDFEKDPLPFDGHSIDTILCCNVLEHIYNYSFLLKEIRRVLTSGGHLIGFVPFWVGYHPDPHDFFRYTHEALEKMLSQEGFVNVHITPVGSGPILANFNTIALSLPRIIRPLIYLGYTLFDAFFVLLRPASVMRNPLGYIFTATS